MKIARPGESSARPSRSSGRPRRGETAGRSRHASAIAARPTGTLTKKIQRQLIWSTIAPPITGPKIGPSRIGTPITLITRPIRCGPEEEEGEDPDPLGAEALGGPAAQRDYACKGQ